MQDGIFVYFLHQLYLHHHHTRTLFLTSEIMHGNYLKLHIYYNVIHKKVILIVMININEPSVNFLIYIDLLFLKPFSLEESISHKLGKGKYYFCFVFVVDKQRFARYVCYVQKITEELNSCSRSRYNVNKQSKRCIDSLGWGSGV